MGSDREGIGYDFSWVDPDGNANFPYVNTDGNSNLNWTDNDFNENWRWLVDVSNSRSFSSAARQGSFFLKSLYPSAEHLADFVCDLRKHDILLGIQRFCFPCDLQKKLKKIQFDARFPQIWQFLLFVQKSRRKKKLYDFKKQCVYLSSEGIAGFFRKMILVFIP